MCLHERTRQRSACHGCPHHGFRLGCCFWCVFPCHIIHHLDPFSSATAILHALFPGLNEVSALCIAACLTPTDPVTCIAITRTPLIFIPRSGIYSIPCLGGSFATKYVPVEIRHILSAEAAANDGMAYPFLSIAIYLTIETSIRAAIGKWFLVGWLCKSSISEMQYQNFDFIPWCRSGYFGYRAWGCYRLVVSHYSTIWPTAFPGFLSSKLMKLSHDKGFIDRESYLTQFFALAVFTAGVASSIGADDLLAAFAAGQRVFAVSTLSSPFRRLRNCMGWSLQSPDGR